tara:strand:+ start:1509 stop:2054 length:546 start_codon:yes stop_codon:yes gene_type:complete
MDGSSGIARGGDAPLGGDAVRAARVREKVNPRFLKNTLIGVRSANERESFRRARGERPAFVDDKKQDASGDVVEVTRVEQGNDGQDVEAGDARASTKRQGRDDENDEGENDDASDTFLTAFLSKPQNKRGRGACSSRVAKEAGEYDLIPEVDDTIYVTDANATSERSKEKKEKKKAKKDRL